MYVTGSKRHIETLHSALRRCSLNDIKRAYALSAIDVTEGKKKEAAGTAGH